MLIEHTFERNENSSPDTDWQRTAFYNDVRDILYVSASFLGDEKENFFNLSLKKELIRNQTYIVCRNHIYVPMQWIMDEYPEDKAALKIIADYLIYKMITVYENDS